MLDMSLTFSLKNGIVSYKGDRTFVGDSGWHMENMFTSKRLLSYGD